MLEGGDPAKGKPLEGNTEGTPGPGAARPGGSRAEPWPFKLRHHRPRPWLGRARQAVPCRVLLAQAVGQAVVPWPLPVQRRPGLGLAPPARQWRAHNRRAAPAPRRVRPWQARRCPGRRTLSPGQGRWADAARLGITLAPLPGDSPDLMPVQAPWRWLREDVTYHHCHAAAEDLTRRVAASEAQSDQNPRAVADRLRVKDHLDPDKKKPQPSR